MADNVGRRLFVRDAGWRCQAWLVLGAILFLFAPAAHAVAGYSDPFTFDATFNGGVVLEDRFAGPATGSHEAFKVVQLSTGDIATVGLVPAAFQSGYGNNVGLVHYSAAGGRVAWPHPTPAYASYSNTYVTFPNSTSATIIGIGDVKAFGGFIYVFAQTYVDSTHYDVQILIFKEDGSLVGGYSVFANSGETYPIALVLYRYVSKDNTAFTRLLAIANAEQAVSPFGSDILTARFGVNPTSGVLSVDTSYGGNGVIRLIQPGNTCSGTSCQRAYALAAAAVRTDTSNPTIYVTATGVDSGATNPGVVFAFDGGTGAINQTFGAYPNDTGSFGPLVATTAGDAASDVLYIYGDTNCAIAGCDAYTPHKGVTKLRAQGGNPFHPTVPALDIFWGEGGQRALMTPTSLTNNPQYNGFNVLQLAISGNRIGLAGFALGEYEGGPSGGSYAYDPMFAVVRLSDGAQTDFQVLPLLRSNGAPWGGNGSFGDINGLGDGRFRVAGDVGDASGAAQCTQSDGCPQFGTAQLSPDDIFSDNFE